MAEPLDLCELPLRGSRLIEASAGTGKTWTIAALYLRLVLGHGVCVLKEGRPLLPAEILVMTFTRAATRELSDRIRLRLAQAAAVFRGRAGPDPADGLLERLLLAYPPGPARETAAWRLSSAADDMDAAAIHTLDAWCQRVLRDHVPDATSGDAAEVRPDGAELKAEAAQDYWRQQVYPLEGPALDLALRLWPAPDRLLADLRQVAERPLPAAAGSGSLAQRIEQALARLAALKARCAPLVGQMRHWLEQVMSQADSPLDGKKLSGRNRQGWLQAIEDWARDPAQPLPLLSPPGRRNLSPQGLRDACKKQRSVDVPSVFEDFDRLMRELEAEPAVESVLRAHAVARIQDRMQVLKASRQLRSHVDVQVQLNEALDPLNRAEAASRLRERLLRRHPVVLVDEFQDTSPLQLSILDRLYRIEDDDAATALLLIGDPKQSIYGFRGADIHSYLRARRATEGRHHALAVNHRATAELVDAVNRLFGAAEARAGEGAFRFRPVNAAGPSASDALPFEPVVAQGRDRQLCAGAQPMPALTLCVDGEVVASGMSRTRYAQRCARAIVTALNDPGTGFRGLDDGSWRALQPRDVAVLVRSHREARAMQAALQACGLRSVFMSDRDSVFDTAEARDLVRVLEAVAAPADSRSVRAALATTLFGLSLHELLALAEDEQVFDVEAERLRALQATWRQQGVLAMIRSLLQLHRLPARWLALDEGERRLTNVLHLAELLQQAAGSLDGEAALLRWLRRQIEGPDATGGGSDEQVLRLESDADRVQLVTVHKSKGLQYPLVFLPFATQVRDPRRDKPWVVWLADGEGQRRAVLGPRDHEREQLQLEDRREDLRLLYVALTRAQYGLWVGASMHRMGRDSALAWERSALGYLLSGPLPVERERILEDLRRFADAGSGIELVLVDGDVPPEALRLRVRQPEAPLQAPLVYAADFDRSWTIASYSALVRDAAIGMPSPRPGPALGDSGVVRQPALREDEADREADRESGPADELTEPALAASSAPWHGFPRGAFAGNFLHRQLEWLADERFALATSPALQRTLRRRCEREGWGHHADDVQRWLERACRQQLPALDASLAELLGPLPEMEFWLPGDGLDLRQLDALCHRFVLPGEARPALVQRQLHGLVMGFADLVFEHAGRFWVLDYKSNVLGPSDAHYDLAAMQRSMLEHRYDVQAALYLLALHRLLRARLGRAYRPEQQLGGALYLFLRGVAGTHAGCFHLEPPMPLLEALDRSLPGGSSMPAGELA